MKKEDKELFEEVRKQDLQEVCLHIDYLAMRLMGESARLKEYMKDYFLPWVSFINEMESTFKSHDVESSLPAFISKFANDRLAFLEGKKAYLEECFALVTKYDNTKKDSMDTVELTAIDAVLTSICNTLGFFYDNDGSFARDWFKGENS